MCYYIIYYEVKEQENTFNTLKLRFFLLKNSKHILGKQKTHETKGRKSNCWWNPTVICGYRDKITFFLNIEKGENLAPFIYQLFYRAIAIKYTASCFVQKPTINFFVRIVGWDFIAAPPVALLCWKGVIVNTDHSPVTT
jgi:hypothetical protein